MSADSPIAIIADINGNLADVTAANALKVDGSAVTQPVSAASLPLPAGAATAALQTQPGVDIGDVTINNASGGLAVNIQDGGNSLTVDATSWPLPTGASTLAEQQSQTTRLNLLVTEATVASMSVTDNTAFADGSNRVTPAGFIYDEAGGTPLSENDAGAARIDVKRAQVLVIEDATTRGQKAAVTASGGVNVNLRNNTGTEIGTAGSPVRVDPTGTTPQPTSSVDTVADNAAFTDGTSRVFPAGFVFDEAAGTALTENDAAAARIDSKRAQVFTLEDATTRGQRATVTANGAVRAEGPGASGVAPVGNPLYVAGQDGTLLRPMLTTIEGVPWSRSYTYQTYHATASAVVLGNGKSMFALANTGTSIVRVWKIFLMNAQTTAVTGVVVDFQLRTFTTMSGGTAVTPLALDSADTLPAGIAAAHNATLTAEAAAPLHQRRWSSDEWGPGTLDVESYDHGQQNSIPFYQWEPPMRPIVLRQNRGISVRCNTNTTAGSWDIQIMFTVETV
jgi:hypothetical protein